MCENVEKSAFLDYNIIMKLRKPPLGDHYVRKESGQIRRGEALC